MQILLIFLACLWGLLASAEDISEDFDFGSGEEQFKWGGEIPLSDDSSDFKLRLGTRLHALMENRTERNGDGSREPMNQDFYIRRARLQVEAEFKENLSYYMDIRADKVDFGDRGENSFALGDAFLQVKDAFGSENLMFRFFRAKYDVSRSQTVSSARLLNPTRASISDYASEYISQARRGTNIQLLGNWSNRLTTQLVFGDSVHESSFYDSLGDPSAILNGHSFAYGARVRVSPFAGWNEGALKETQFGRGQHLTLGAGAFFVDNINFSVSPLGGQQNTEVDRSLYNFDLSFHWGSFSLMSEYFVFEGMVENFAAGLLRQGNSEGWVTQFEYVLTDFHYLAPYVRLQSWDRFQQNDGYSQDSWLVGLNYYLQGNKLRLGATLESTDFGEGLTNTGQFSDSETVIGMNFMMHY